MVVNNSLFCNKDIISRIQVDPKLQKPFPFTIKYRFFNFSSSRNSVIINGTATWNRSETYLGLSFLFLKSVVESLPLRLSCCRSLKLLPFISPPSLSYRSLKILTRYPFQAGQLLQNRFSVLRKKE